MNQSSSTSGVNRSMKNKIFEFIFLSSLTVLITFIIMFSIDWIRGPVITEESICNRLIYQIGLSQGKTIRGGYSSSTYPSLEGAEILNTEYEGTDDLGICTVRIKLPNGDEYFYTRIVSRNNVDLINIIEQYNSCNENDSHHIHSLHDQYKDHFFFITYNNRNTSAR